MKIRKGSAAIVVSILLIFSITICVLLLNNRVYDSNAATSIAYKYLNKQNKTLIKDLELGSVYQDKDNDMWYVTFGKKDSFGGGLCISINASNGKVEAAYPIQ